MCICFLPFSSTCVFMADPTRISGNRSNANSTAGFYEACMSSLINTCFTIFFYLLKFVAQQIILRYLTNYYIVYVFVD